MGLASAALFSLNAIFVKIGMRRRPVDNGHFMSILVNIVFLGMLMLYASLPPWSWTGFVVFVVAGLMTMWVGRGTSFMAIRLIGPARQAAILVSAPLFAAITGWFLLDEAITVVQAAGGIIISFGLLVLLKSRIEQDGDVDRAVPATQHGPTTTRTNRVRLAILHDQFVRGFTVALLSAMFFGAGFVVSKWGLSYLPSAIGGAFLGTCTALLMIVLRSAVKRGVGRLARDNFREIPWWFVAGGAASTAALLFQFTAFTYLPAWVVSLLQGTQALWTLLWSAIFLRQEERIGRELLLSVALVVVGVAITTDAI